MIMAAIASSGEKGSLKGVRRSKSPAPWRPHAQKLKQVLTLSGTVAATVGDGAAAADGSPAQCDGSDLFELRADRVGHLQAREQENGCVLQVLIPCAHAPLTIKPPLRLLSGSLAAAMDECVYHQFMRRQNLNKMRMDHIKKGYLEGVDTSREQMMQDGLCVRPRRAGARARDSFSALAL